MNAIKKLVLVATMSFASMFAYADIEPMSDDELDVASGQASLAQVQIDVYLKGVEQAFGQFFAFDGLKVSGVVADDRDLDSSYIKVPRYIESITIDAIRPGGPGAGSIGGLAIRGISLDVLIKVDPK